MQKAPETEIPDVSDEVVLVVMEGGGLSQKLSASSKKKQTRK